jgi:hypothetical protein
MMHRPQQYRIARMPPEKGPSHPTALSLEERLGLAFSDATFNYPQVRLLA